MAHHVAIGIDGGEDEKAPICVVCMDPMEWVAVSPCGHREVCVRCAASSRFFHNDLRCCICRSHCPTVVVTKASRSTCGQRGFPFLWPAPPAFAGQVQVGQYYWYHHGMGAYFDDVHQYQEMKKACTTTSTSSEESRAAGGAPVVNYLGRSRDALFPQPAANVNVNLNVSVSPRQAVGPPLEEPSSSSEDVGTSLVWIAVLLSLLTIGGFLMVAEHPYPKVLICALFPAFTACTVYVWRKFSNNSLQWGWMS